jgi:hypothetical protein
MMGKLREVEIKAVNREENEERKCSQEYDELRLYVARLRTEAEAEVHEETQAEAQAARMEIRSVEERTDRINHESVAHGIAAASATRTEESQVAFLKMQLQSRLSSHEAISEGLVRQAKTETEQYKQIADNQLQDLKKEEIRDVRFEKEEMEQRMRDAMEVERQSNQRIMGLSDNLRDAESQRMAMYTQELNERLLQSERDKIRETAPPTLSHILREVQIISVRSSRSGSRWRIRERDSGACCGWGNGAKSRCHDDDTK